MLGDTDARLAYITCVTVAAWVRGLTYKIKSSGMLSFPLRRSLSLDFPLFSVLLSLSFTFL